MKIRLMSLIGLLLATPAVAQIDISPELEKRVTALLNHLDEVNAAEQFTMADYRKALVEIADEIEPDDPLRQQLKLNKRWDKKSLLLKLATHVQDPVETERIEDLSGWYGRPYYQIDVEFVRRYYAKRKVGTYRLPVLPQNSPPPRNYRDRKAKMHQEHLMAEYLNAWQFWLLAPPSKERSQMTGHMYAALQTLSDASQIPVLTEVFKVEIKRTKSFYNKRHIAMQFMNMICSKPSDKALDAMLEFNRYVLENDLNGEGYKSFSRYCVRLLTSRRMYADQMTDPKIIKMYKESGRGHLLKEKIPLTGDLWKKYKPLVEAKLRTKTDETPQEDVALLQAAMEVMPGN